MSDSRNNGKKKVGTWLIIGVLVLIALLLIWLTVADMFGDTDVAAQLLNSAGKSVASLGLPVA